MSILTPLLLTLFFSGVLALFSYATSVPYHIGVMIRFVLMSDLAILGAAGNVLGAVTGVIRRVPTLFLEYVFFFRFTLPVYVEAIKRLPEQLWASCISWQDLIAWLRSFVACEPPETFLFFSTFPQTRYCELYNKIYNVAPVLSRFDRILLVILICLTCLVVILAAGITFRHRIQELVMYILTPRAVRFYLTPDPLRSQFVLQPMQSSFVDSNHSHGESAADRTTCVSFMERFASLLGLNLYMIQRSRPDERKGRDGCRVAYFAKDLQVEQANFDPPDNALLAFVDSDQHVDMPAFMCDNFTPMLLYSFQPTQAARTTNNYSYTFLANNEVDYLVSGGGRYTHMVWNYGQDSILVQKTLFGVPYKVAIYLVDRRQSSLDHELVLLTPVRMWAGLFAPFVPWFIQGKPLVRLTPVTGKFVRLMSQSKGGLLISTGTVGNFAQASVSVDVDDTLATIARTSKYDLTMPQVVSFTEGDRVAGATLLEYHRSRVQAKPAVVCPVAQAIQVYQFQPITYDPVNKPLLVPFMHPMLGDCFVPASGKASEQEAVNERVEKVKSPILEVTTVMSTYMDEFLEFLIPEAHGIDPVDDDELYDRQARPTQRRILDLAQFSVGLPIINSFIKKESYGDVKPPRLISTVNGTDKAAYSKFIYAFTQHCMKVHAWYAFGKTPQEIAQRVTDVCVKAKHNVANSDFHRFDGHVSNVLRELERRALIRAFRRAYHEELLKLHKSQHKCKGYTTEGVEYDSEYTRASGSAETASFNGLANAFVSYMQARMNDSDGVFQSPEEAWETLGIYGGDDGLTADIIPETYVRAAQSMGQEIEVELVTKGSLGVKFLSRQYSPHVWDGDLNSCADLPRQLTKIHVSVALGLKVTPVMKLLEKCRAYMLTDENTPILGEFARRVCFLHNGPIEPNPSCAQIAFWLAKYPKDVQYPNEAADWMAEYTQSVLPEANIKCFREWLLKTTSLQDMLSPPLLCEPKSAKSAVPVVVRDEILPRGVKLDGKHEPSPPKPCERKAVQTAAPARLDCKQKQPIIPIGHDKWGNPHKLTIQPVVKKVPDRPPLTAARFEEWRLGKIKDGTWKERREPSEVASGSRPKEG